MTKSGMVGVWRAVAGLWLAGAVLGGCKRGDPARASATRPKALASPTLRVPDVCPAIMTMDVRRVRDSQELRGVVSALLGSVRGVDAKVMDLAWAAGAGTLGYCGDAGGANFVFTLSGSGSVADLVSSQATRGLVKASNDAGVAERHIVFRQQVERGIFVLASDGPLADAGLAAAREGRFPRELVDQVATFQLAAAQIGRLRVLAPPGTAKLSYTPLGILVSLMNAPLRLEIAVQFSSHEEALASVLDTQKVLSELATKAKQNALRGGPAPPQDAMAARLVANMTVAAADLREIIVVRVQTEDLQILAGSLFRPGKR